MTESGRDFGKWNQDEVALKHAGMRNLEISGGNSVVAIEKDVEIDEARPLGEGFSAAHLRFDVAECAEKLKGGENRLRFEDGVEEPGLVEEVDGLGFVNAGYLYDGDTGFGEETDGLAQVFLAVTNVGAERQVNGRHMRYLSYANAAAEKADQGMGFRQFEGKGRGEKDDAIEAKDDDGNEDMSAQPQKMEKAASRAGSE